jgi:hypothetical protein
MTADYAALEARVAELEQQIRHILPAKIDAVSFGLNIVHEDLRALGDASEDMFGRLETRLDRHGEMLQEILRRLPAEPSAAD